MLADIFPTGWHATRAGRAASRRIRRDLWRRPRWPHGGVFGHDPRRQAGHGGRSASRPPATGREHRRDRHRRFEGRSRSSGSQDLTRGLGADKGCECVGWQAHDPAGNEQPNATMNRLVQSVRATGVIGVVGVFVPEDPKSPDALMKKGRIAFDFGRLLRERTAHRLGQANVKAYNRELRDLIHADGQAVVRGLASLATSTRRPTPTPTSTPARTDGPRSSSRPPHSVGAGLSKKNARKTNRQEQTERRAK